MKFKNNLIALCALGLILVVAAFIVMAFTSKTLLALWLAGGCVLIVSVVADQLEKHFIQNRFHDLR